MLAQPSSQVVVLEMVRPVVLATAMAHLPAFVTVRPFTEMLAVPCRLSACPPLEIVTFLTAPPCNCVSVCPSPMAVNLSALTPAPAED